MCARPPAHRPALTVAVALASALLLLAAHAAGGDAVASISAVDGPATAPTDPEALEDLLAYTPVPEDPVACSWTTTGPSGSLSRGPCDAEPATASPAATQQPAFSLVPRHVIETPQSWGPYVPLSGPVPDAVLRVHGWGDVAVMDADGHTVWSRGSRSFYDDWDGLSADDVPFVQLGISPANPFTPLTERPYAVGDLTDDGVDDVVVAHRVDRDDGDRFFVTVLDGTTGASLWTQEFAGFTTQLHVEGTTLLVAEEGADGDTSRLHAFDPAFESGGLRIDEAWTLDSEATEARWLALEPFGDGRVALALTSRPVGSAGDAGRVITVRTSGDEAGTVDWSVSTDGYPRFLRGDETRDALLVHLQTDPQEAWGYALVELDLDGVETARRQRQDALLLSLAVGDLTGDGASEWIVGDAEVTDDGLIRAGRVIAIDPDTGTDSWVHRTDGDSPEGMLLTYGLLPRDGRLAAASRTFQPVDLTDPIAPSSFLALADGGALAEAEPDLRLLDGVGGDVRWTQADAVLPLYLEPVVVDGQDAVLGGTDALKMRAYAADGGGRLVDAPLLAGVHSVEVAEQSDGGRHLVVGTGSGGVFSLPADGLGTVPDVAWRASVRGAVRTVELTDVTGDGTPEVVVAATNSVAVLDAADGTIVTDIPIEDGYVWTVTAADLTGDGAGELIVPTSTLAAYDLDGEQLWQYAPMEALEAGDTPTYFSNAVVSGGRVLAQHSFDPPSTFLGTRSAQLLVAVEGDTGSVAWLSGNASPASIPRFWYSTVVLPGSGVGGGDAVGFVYDQFVPSGWHAAALAHDVTTGAQLWAQGPAPSGGIVNRGAFERDGDLYRVHSTTLTRHRAEGLDQIRFPGSVTSARWADLGTLGETFLASSFSSVAAYSPEIPWGDPSDRLGEALRWEEPLLLGAFTVDHLDDGDVPQVVAHRYDYDAYQTVAAFEGVFSSLLSTHPEAIVVLDAVAGDGS